MGALPLQHWNPGPRTPVYRTQDPEPRRGTPPADPASIFFGKKPIHRQFLCFCPPSWQGEDRWETVFSRQPRNKQSSNLSPASSELVISGTAVITHARGRPTSSLRSRKDSSSPGQGPVRFLQFPSSPPPFRPPLATCWCRLSKQPAGAEGASCTRGTPARPAAATAAKQQPPSPQKPVRPPERGEAKATTTLRVTGLERPGHPSFPVLVRCAPSEHRANNEHRTGISPPPSKLLAHPSILSSLDSSAASLVHLLVRQWRRGRRLPLRRRVRCHQ